MHAFYGVRSVYRCIGVVDGGGGGVVVVCWCQCHRQQNKYEYSSTVLYKQASDPVTKKRRLIYR